MSEELIPCPFCNGKAIIERMEPDYDMVVLFRINCNGCPFVSFGHRSTRVLLDWWNTRHNPLKWFKTDKPLAPGFYWTRDVWNDGTKSEEQIGEFTEDQYIDLDGTLNFEDLCLEGSEFAGPIPRPPK